MNYPVPNFGLDEDIKTSQANEAAASAKLGHKWVPKTEEIELADDLKWGSLMQLSSDPICPSSGCFEKKKKYPRNYFVPDFGVDSDIVSTQKNIDDAEEAEADSLKAVDVKPEPVGKLLEKI